MRAGMISEYPKVRHVIGVARLIHLGETLRCLDKGDDDDFAHVANMMEAVIRARRDVRTDRRGFDVLCEKGNLAWVRVAYLQDLAERGECCPR